jgi:integrase
MPGGGDGAPIRLRPFRLNPKRSFLVSAPTANLIRGHAHRRQASKTKERSGLPQRQGEDRQPRKHRWVRLEASNDPRRCDRACARRRRKPGGRQRRASAKGRQVHRAALLCELLHQQQGRRRDGPPAEIVQKRLGHSSIVMTLDVYGHLFPRGDDHVEQMEAAAQRLLGLAAARISPDSGPGRMQRIC